MAKTIESVMKMVESELATDPDISNEALYEKARKVDKSIADLTLRQFHARYPLQVKRRRAASGRSRKRRSSRTRSRKAASPGAGSREAVREALLRFARDVSAAEGKADMIDLVAGLDRYVDEVLAAANGTSG